MLLQLFFREQDVRFLHTHKYFESFFFSCHIEVVKVVGVQ